jgi:chromosome segregation ATPase
VRRAAVSKIAARIPGEIVEFYEGRIETLDEERAEKQEAVIPLRDRYVKLREQTAEAKLAWEAALRETRSLGNEAADLRREIQRLQTERDGGG